jgi:ADP-ribose pyrophosphatase YjhB (NUDIX family)
VLILGKDEISTAKANQMKKLSTIALAGIGKGLQVFHQLRCYYWRVRQPTRVGIRALIVRDNTVLLVKHTYLPGWYLPGGKVDRGETVWEALVREVAEECALRVKQARLIGVYSNREQNPNDHIVFFIVEDFEPTSATRLMPLEIAASQFFSLQALPLDTSAATRRRIQEYNTANFDQRYW